MHMRALFTCTTDTTGEYMPYYTKFSLKLKWIWSL